MTRIKYDITLLKFMSLFETITRSELKDCFVDGNGLLTFVVSEGYIGKAIGKGSQNVMRLEKLLNRKIKIVEFNPSLQRFVQNLVYPLRPEITVEGQSIEMKGADTRMKGLLIGRNGQNLKNLQDTVNKYFSDIKIKVV